MTWYTHEVIAPGSQKVARVVASDPMLAPFSYRLHGPLEHAWHRPEVAHGFPEAGLIVVRPVCGLADDYAEWYGEPVLDWGLLRATDTSSPLDPAAVAQACGVNNAFLPPESFLSFLQALATRAEATSLFYSCSTWGGDIESEYAFVLGRSPSAIVALPQDRDEDGCPRVVVIDGARQTPAMRDVCPSRFRLWISRSPRRSSPRTPARSRGRATDLAGSPHNKPLQLTAHASYAGAGRS